MIVRIIKIGLAVIFSIVTLVLLWTTIYRWTWNYNENGVHFDEQSMTTFSDGAIGAYALLAILFFMLTMLLWRWVKRIPVRQ